jgi:hypothetical protein
MGGAFMLDVAPVEADGTIDVAIPWEFFRFSRDSKLLLNDYRWLAKLSFDQAAIDKTGFGSQSLPAELVLFQVSGKLPGVTGSANTPRLLPSYELPTSIIRLGK